MSAYGDLLTAATQQGGRRDGWPDDVWSLIVWAAIGSGEWPDITPELEIAEHRQLGGDPATVLLSLSATLVDQPLEIVLAAAWAGLARHATDQRDEMIRKAEVSARQIGDRIGLSHTAIGKIRARD